MRLKTFHAPDVPTALRQIKEELGPEAIIVSTREGRPGPMGLLRRRGVEITAAVDRSAVTPAPAKPKPEAKLKAPSPLRTARTYAVVDDDTVAPALTESPTYGRMPKRASRTSAASASKQVAEPAPSAVLDHVPDHERPRESVLFYVRPLREEIQSLTRDLAKVQSEFTEDRASRARTGGGEIRQVRSDIAELRHLVGKVATIAVDPLPTSLPEPLRAHAMQLADNGVDLATLHESLRRLADTLTAEQLAQHEYVRECVLTELMRPIAVASALEPTDNRARVVALVGPTGVGKTTTIAKLAGHHLAYNPEGRVALITLDTFRAGAFNHLKVYGDALGVPVHVAKTAAELEKLVRRQLDHDLILIDTAGGNQRDDAHLDALQRLLSANPLVEIHLCVSATTKSRDLWDIHERHEGLAIEKLIFTKTDETNAGGSLYNFLTRSGRPLAFLTNGQRVPEDLQVATKSAFCRWVMGS